MAAPNIVNVSTITGKTASANASTTQANVASNAASSGKVLKVNSLYITNIDGTNAADISVSLLRSSVNYYIASTLTVPADSTIVVISKDSSIYLEEGDGLTITASANGDLQAVCSYEEIS